MTEIDSDNRILIDYYEGAYGPTIRINVHSIETVMLIRDIFLKLATAEISEVDLHEINLVKMTNIKAIILKLERKDKEPQKTLKLIQTVSKTPMFYWSRSSEGWQEGAALLDGIVKHGQPGHQYFTDEAIDDALIEIAFLEG